MSLKRVKKRREKLSWGKMESEAKQKQKQHPRLILHNFLSDDQCKELEFIHKSNSTVGYRPNVFSTTLSHLIATNSPHLLLPFVPIRETLKDKVEDFFDCQFDLFIEFTGLIRLDNTTLPLHSLFSVSN